MGYGGFGGRRLQLKEKNELICNIIIDTKTFLLMEHKRLCHMLRYHPEIREIIKDLQLHLEVENSLDSFENTSCDVIQKINNYIFVCELTAI